MSNLVSKPQDASLVETPALSDDHFDEVAGGTIKKLSDQASPIFFKNDVGGTASTTAPTK